MVDVSVVIPARNAELLLPPQLEALVAQDAEFPFEVIVVDNLSTDGTAAAAASFADRLDLRVSACRVPGPNAARNTGIEHAQGRLILCCDADDVVDTGWVREMVGALGDHTLVGGRLEYERLNDDAAIAARGDLLAVSGLPVYRGQPYALGGNLGMHRTVFDAIGGFDPALLIGADEPDFSFRAGVAGHRAVFVPGAVVHYRLRLDRRAMMRQIAGYALGSAQLDAKIERLGLLPPQSGRSKLAAVAGHGRALLTPASRAVYARKAAWAYGCFAGWRRFGRFVA